MSTLRMPLEYYQQFDADINLDVPAEAYGGWKKSPFDISLRHTGVVVMHAWNSGTPDQYPGWHRAIEYHGRADRICREVFPPLLAAVRSTDMPLFHVVDGGNYYQHLPGYQHAVTLAEPRKIPVQWMQPDASLLELRRFKEENVHVGRHNEADIKQGFENIDFPEEARPQASEGIAENAAQLFGLCQERGVNHLIYAGFAINWCILLSPGGMVDMSRKGIMCSAFRQAVTAVENRETAREEWCKQVALWRVALAFGFVVDVTDFIAAVDTLRKTSAP